MSFLILINISIQKVNQSDKERRMHQRDLWRNDDLYRTQQSRAQLIDEFELPDAPSNLSPQFMTQWAREQAQREIAYIESREERIRQDVEQAVRLYEESLQQGEDETSGKPFNIEILFTEIPSRTVEFLETAEKDEQFFKGVQPMGPLSKLMVLS